MRDQHKFPPSTFWHRAAAWCLARGEAAMRRERARAIAGLDAELRKDIGWPSGDRMG